MKITVCRKMCLLLLSVLTSLCSTGVTAVDFNINGFGTLGYAASDQDFRYLRFIDEGGTFKTDTLFGLQAEAQFSSQWSATVQAVASASLSSDKGQEVNIRWAFVSYRPDNDWLVRVGRLRPPFFIHSQNAEVGVTFDQVRLPTEVYSLTPNFDFDGAAVTKTWALENAEFNLDAYWGKSEIAQRIFLRDQQLARYEPIKLEVTGLILSYSTAELLLRGGAHRGISKRKNGQPFTNTFAPTDIPIPPPLGGTLFQPSGSSNSIDFWLLTLGGDWNIDDWRVTGEYTQLFVDSRNKTGASSKGVYITVARKIGKWTPYVTQARLFADPEVKSLFDTVNSTPVPLAVQGAPLFVPANLHRILADTTRVADQYSTALGVAYSFSPTSKAKFEWLRTHIGLTSNLVDGDVRNKSFNVFSVSYSVAF